MTSLTAPTPQERLASSRKAIVRHMSRDAHDDRQEDDGTRQDEDSNLGNFEGGTWGILKHALGAWWHHHPVSVAFGLAKPALKHYAEEKPLQLLGIAAAAGAAAVVLRPWRLVSIGSLLLATLKSSELSGALLSMLSGASSSSDSSESSEQTPRSK
jgi:hypothetical protein